MKNLVLILIITLALFGCKKETITVLDPNQKVFFQFDYINYAWGRMHQGWILDSSGNFHTYDEPENWIFPDSTDVITERAMQENLSKTQLGSKVVSTSELKQKIALIVKASKGKISEPENRMADAGILSYNAFIYDAENKEYKVVVLHQWGEWVKVNDAPEANELYEWLKNLNPN